MSTHRGPRISRAEAERLLRTGEGGPAALSALLSAAASPAAARELAGEREALTQFRAMRTTPISSRRRRFVVKTALANLLSAKLAAAAAVAATATGGIALAAATGHLSGSSHDASPGGAPSSVVAGSHTPGAPETESDSASGTDSSSAPGTDTSSAPGSDTASPSPSLMGLCKAYQAGATNNPGKALTNPAFSVLVAAAGGADNVATYCATLVGPAPTHPAGRPTGHVTGAPISHPVGRPSSVPVGPPSSHPTGAPISHPTGAPTTHPTGRP